MLFHPLHLHILCHQAETHRPVGCEAGERKTRFGHPAGGPQFVHTCAQSPVFTPTFPLTLSVYPLLSWCPLDFNRFVRCLFHAKKSVILLCQCDGFKGGTPGLGDNPPSPHFLLLLGPIHLPPTVCEGISPVHSTAKLGSQRASSPPPEAKWL